MKKIVLLVLCVVVASGQMFAATTKHPNVWITQEERAGVLELIDKYDWAKDIVSQMKDYVEETADQHIKNPGAVVADFPSFPANNRVNRESAANSIASANSKIISKGYYAAVLYYITEETKYAQLAADVFGAYVDQFAPLTPETTTVTGYAFFDPRIAYGTLAIAYDFTYNYMNQPGSKVYSRAEGKYVAYDNDKAQVAIKNMIGSVLQEYGKPDVHGKTISNHPILTAPGALFPILCVDDVEERDRLLEVFWERGTAHQNSFKHTILPLFSEQGIWPESVSYGFMPIVTMTINIIDRVKPEWNVSKDCIDILNGNFFFDYLRNPDRTFVCYGDSHRYNDNTRELYQYTLDLSKRRGYDDLVAKAEVALSQSYRASDGYHPNMTPGVHNSYKPLQLLWGYDIPKETGADVDFNVPTVIVKHAGVAVQRNAVEKKNEMYGLTGLIGGAHYVHSHLTGIAMELYGSEYVMAPNAALPPTVAQRKIPLHEHYFRIYAGNNTVVVNGTSHGLDEGSWKGLANVWQNRAYNVAAEPEHLQQPTSKNFSFATQRLDDEVNNCTQERTLAIVRTSPTTGYYFDMFRSVSSDENKFHDYIYHNIGDEMHLMSTSGKTLETTPTDRYQNDIGDTVHSPGWRYFEQTCATESMDDAVNVRFDVNYDGRHMFMFMPSGVDREYTTALAPPTREARNGYVDKKTQVLVARQYGEAWDRPFVSVFEPSASKKSSVQSVDPINNGEKVIGVKVISKVNGTVITDYILNQATDEAVFNNKKLGISFTGRYAVVRLEQKKGSAMKATLYIGSGDSLKYKGVEVKADAKGVAFKECEL